MTHPSFERFENEAAGLVARELSRITSTHRPAFLRALLAHTAAGLVVVCGDTKAAEDCYRLADAVVARARK